MVAIFGGMLGENREKLLWWGKLLGKQSKLATVGEKIVQRCNGGEIFGESNSSLYLFLLPGATIKPSPPNCIEALIISRTALKKATYYCPTFNFEFAFCHRFLHITFGILHLANDILQVNFCINCICREYFANFIKQTAFCIYRYQNSRDGQLFVFSLSHLFSAIHCDT